MHTSHPLHNAVATWGQTSTPAELLLAEAQSLAFYPSPYTASPSFAMIRSPWYLDYGHLTFWFFFFSTFVIVAWLAYMYVGLTQYVEQRRPIRETRGFSRAQTGDTLTAVLPLTWSITMLLHAGTHSSNFDENTTAAAFSFTVIAYQWGWNYYFPREIAELLVTAPQLVGRGRLLVGTAQDPYALLLARARRDYATQTRLSTQLTAAHGRHVVASTLSLLLPTLVNNTLTVPSWAVGGLNLTAAAALPAGDARLALGVTAAAGLTEGARLAALWQRYTPTRATSRVVTTAGCAEAGQSYISTGQLVAGGSSVLPITSCWPTQLETQGLRSQPAVTLVGNRLHRVHQHLATAESGSAPTAGRAHVAAFIARHATPKGLGSSTLTAALRATPLETPLAAANIWANLYLRAYLTNPLTSGVWAQATAVQPAQPALGAGAQSQTQSSLAPLSLPTLPTTSPWPSGVSMVSFGAAQPDFLTYTSNGAYGVAQQRLITLRGSNVGVLGGADRTLTAAEGFANISASAAEYAWSRQAQAALHSPLTAAASAHLAGARVPLHHGVSPHRAAERGGSMSVAGLAAQLAPLAAGRTSLQLGQLPSARWVALNGQLDATSSRVSYPLLQTALTTFEEPLLMLSSTRLPRTFSLPNVESTSTTGMAAVSHEVLMSISRAAPNAHTRCLLYRLLDHATVLPVRLPRARWALGADTDPESPFSARNWAARLRSWPTTTAKAEVAVSGEVLRRIWDASPGVFYLDPSWYSTPAARATLVPVRLPRARWALGAGLDLESPFSPHTQAAITTATAVEQAQQPKPLAPNFAAIGRTWGYHAWRPSLNLIWSPLRRWSGYTGAVAVSTPVVDMSRFANPLGTRQAATVIPTLAPVGTKAGLISPGHSLRPQTLYPVGASAWSLADRWSLNASAAPAHSTGAGVLNGPAAMVTLSSLAPNSMAAWVESVSELRPTRSAAPESGEPLYINGRNSIPGTPVAPVFTHPQLAAWSQLWSWSTATASLPWDRTFWTQYARHPQTGLNRPAAALAEQEQAALLPLQRRHFDKSAAFVLAPQVRTVTRQLWFPELGLAVLDADRASIVNTCAVTLPAPHVDLDPTFVFTRWAAEVNTSRRSDHDAKFRVLWGPLAAAAGLPHADLETSAGWPHTSGPSALSALATATRRQLTLFVEADLTSTLAQSASGLAGIANTGVVRASQGAAAPVVTSLGTSILQTMPSGVLATSEAPMAVAALNASSGLRGPWTHLWQPRPWGQRPTVRHAGVFSGDVASYWTLRFAASLALQTQLGVEQLGAQSRVQGNLVGGAAVQAELQPAAVTALLDAPTTAFANHHRGGYLPMQTDIGSMRRLRVTKGVCLPADVAMHGIFGSKDVIHSWAIPGLGVKIDCIPGYSSHRRVVFRWRGLFWGQCMEVCGRYHHWMPLLVRVVHRDSFLVWCLTYIRALAARPVARTRQLELVAAQGVWAVAAQQRR